MDTALLSLYFAFLLDSNVFFCIVSDFISICATDIYARMSMGTDTHMVKTENSVIVIVKSTKMSMKYKNSSVLSRIKEMSFFCITVYIVRAHYS